MTRNYFMRIFEEMPTMIYNNRDFIAVLFAALLLLGSCKKTVEDISQKTVQQYFEETILNKNFVVEYAKDTNDITSRYSNDTFVLKKGATYYDGVMTGKKGTTVYTGTWLSNEDYSKLEININTPAPPPSEFAFLNRAWKFTKKSLPIMELAPWGAANPKVLHMRRL